MVSTKASLEALVETGILPCASFHPGGTEVSEELARMCNVGKDAEVLDVACGNGATACFLAERFGCRVVGIDATELQVRRATSRTADWGLPLEFCQADAYRLPFADNTFDAVISEAFLCHVDVLKAVSEMTRVAKAGGYVGTHDLCWKTGAPEETKRQFADIENETPQTLDEWADTFRLAGLVDIQTIDKSGQLPQWNAEYRRQIGPVTQLKMFFQILKQWGFAGYRRIRESQRIWEGEHMGYGIVVGSKPPPRPPRAPTTA